MSDMLNERLPALPPVPGARPTFPLVQAPSTRRRRGSADDMDIEKKFRHMLEDNVDDEDLTALADSISHPRGRAARPQTLKRHETV